MKAVDEGGADGSAGAPQARRLFGLVEIAPGEGLPVALAAAYGFCLMAAYNVIKPYREALGTSVPKLSDLWYSTLVATCVVLIPYWALVGRLPRQRFIPWVHRFFEVAFAAFFFLLRDEKQPWFRTSAIVFYAGVSAFNLLVLSQFWGFMADAFSRDQGLRLFAWIAAGGTAGGLIASLATTSLAHNRFGPSALIWLTIVLLELATFAATTLARRIPPSAWRPPSHVGIGGRLADVFAGARLFARSPYLLAIAAYMFVSLFTSGFVYDFQRLLIKATYDTRAAQTEYNASINTLVQIAALAGQTLFSARLLSAAGLGVTLALLHLTGVTGLIVFALHPTLYVISGVQIALKGVDYALAKPAREALFTVVSRTEKYQSKSLIDAGLYRAFDALDSSIIDRLKEMQMAAPTMAWVAVPVTAVGVVLSAVLAHLQKRRLRVAPPLELPEEP